MQEAKGLVQKSQQQLQHIREKMVERFIGSDDNPLPFLCVEFKDQMTGEERVVPVVCIGSSPSLTVETDTQVTHL